AQWCFSLYPQAAEGGGCLSRRGVALASDSRPDAERAAEEAARRARAKIRRYAAANRLNRLGTLTYRGEGCHDPHRLRDDLAGFAGRDLGDERRPAGLHRYEVAQGFQPEKILCYGVSAEDVIKRASGVIGSGPERVWMSSSVEGWHGPPACWARWI